MTRIPATIVTGFLGAGKTTLLSHLATHAGGRRIAFIVNEFGDIGVDGAILAGCTLPGCDEADVIELANGCICCTVADDFLPTIESLLARPMPPDHIVIETSGLALPKPLVAAFAWPEVSARVTVDAVVTVVDAEAAASGRRFAPDAQAQAAQAVPAGDAPAHQQELHELFGDQVACADLVLLTKTDRIDGAAEARARAIIDEDLRTGVRVLTVTEGRIAPELLLGLGAAAESDLAARASHHDLEGHGEGNEEADHGHDAFRSFALPLAEIDDPAKLLAAVERLFAAAPVFRVKGFVAVAGKPMRYLVQGVGGRASGRYDQPWGSAPRSGSLIVIGAASIDPAGLADLLSGA